jgi:hypothetical protein
LIIVGVGIGVGEGIGVGVGPGLGDWARAEDAAAITRTSTNAIAAAFASQRPTPVSVFREGRGEQLINAIPKASIWRDAQNLSDLPAFPQRVNRSQPLTRGDCEALWFQRHSLLCVI